MGWQFPVIRMLIPPRTITMGGETFTTFETNFFGGISRGQLGWTCPFCRQREFLTLDPGEKCMYCFGEITEVEWPFGERELCGARALPN
jgi:hypothetical protein